MACFCYIIYSPRINKFYVGESENPELRLTWHNQHAFDGSFTKIARDWELFLKIACKDRVQARKVEAFIKKMKSKKFILRLKEEPELINQILIKVT